MLGVSVTLFGIGTFAARRQEVNLAAGCVAVGASLAIITFYTSWALLQGIDPFILTGFASFNLAIVLVGILAETWMVLGVTVVMNIFTILLLMYSNNNTLFTAIIQQQTTFLGVQGIIQQWSFALLLLIVAGAFRRTLHELGDTRIAYDRAQKLDKLKDQFITNVNHELRNPVMALQSCVEVLALVGNDLPDDERLMLFEQARHAGDDLIQLLSSILDARRLDATTDTHALQSVALAEVVTSAIGMVNLQEGHTPQRPLSVHVSTDLMVWGDPVGLRQIVVNLLSNATKYSPVGTSIELAAYAIAVTTDQRLSPRGTVQAYFVELTVRDYGLGIPPEQIPLLFHRFVRLPRDLASNVSGNGLGLHVCRMLAESMHGSIWVESSGIKGEGATFHLRLPQALREEVAL